MSAQPHVLIVEDNQLVIGAMRMLFESADWRVSTAEGIKDAIATSGADAADLVLLDLTLADGDGLSAIEPLRAAGCKTFVALTGRDDPETRQRCLDAGCVDVLLKPVPARELVDKSKAWLG